MSEERKFRFVRCVKCGGPTTWRYGWKHEGRCPRCVAPDLAAKVAEALADERRARILARTREE